MKRRTVLASAMALILAIGIGWAALGPASAPRNVVSANQEGVDSGRLTLAQPKDNRQRPLVLVLADNDGTETTDFLVPLGVLRRAGVADVQSVSTREGVVSLMPALSVWADMTLNGFELQHPHGADIIIVPAMHHADRPEILTFLQSQAAKGAFIVAICEGAAVVANAGLFVGRKATTHWSAFDGLARRFPQTIWVRDARYVVDGPVMSTTGVTASIPASLALIEAIADGPTALEAASQLGVPDWSQSYDSAAFSLQFGTVFTAAWNSVSFWKSQTVQIAVEEGFDEVALGLQADAWSRTYASKAEAVGTGDSVLSSQGVLIEVNAPRLGPTLSVLKGGGTALGETLVGIEQKFDAATASFVALQLEYPTHAVR